MSKLRALLVRIGGLFNTRRADRDFDDEIKSHLEMHMADNVRAGMTPAEARRHALIKLGGLQQTKERYRDRRGLPAIDAALQDLRLAARLMWRTPGFTLVAVVTLALGIGANTVMFSVVNTVLLRPLPYRDPSRLLLVRTIDAARRPSVTSPPDFYAYRARNRTLDSIDAFYLRPLNLTGGQDPERVSALIASSGFFDTLGTPPILGRGFRSADEQWGAHRVVVLGDGLWKRRFGADPRVLGTSVTINAESYVVVGVLPPGFSFVGLDAQVFVPMAFAPGDNMNSHNNSFLNMIARLKAGAPAAQALADLNRISEAIIAEYPENKGTAVNVEPLRDALVGDVRRPVLVMLGAVGCVLLIACANLANLLLARGAVRQREIVVRTAIGATRGRLIRQFLTESVLLAAVGGAAGLALAYFSIDALNLLSQSALPRAEDIRIDQNVMLFTLAAAAFTGILFGVVPAMHTSAVDLNNGLKEGARTASDGAGRHRLRATLVVAEVALSLVLLVGAGLMMKSMYRLLSIDAGFDTRGILTMQINLPAQKYVDQRLERQFSHLAYSRSVRFFTDVVERVRSVPGVRVAGAVNGLPLMGEIWGKNVVFYDRPLPADLHGLSPIQYRVVAGDYFSALGIRILNGRAFADSDTLQAPKVAIVNRELARRYWDGHDPVGQIISVNPPLQLFPDQGRHSGLPADFQPDKFTVVGVADDARYGRLSNPALPVVYTPYAQGSEGTTNMYLTVRTDGDPLALAASIREQIRQVDRDQPVAGVQTMEARVSASVAQPRLQMTVLGVFAALAFLLATIGIYGVMSYAVTQRTREIGIRMALGAARRDVLMLVLRQAFTVLAIGLTLGLAGAALVTRVLRTLLFEVSPTDPAVFGAIVVVLTATGWVAAYVPARRAAMVNPLATLRSE